MCVVDSIASHLCGFCGGTMFQSSWVHDDIECVLLIDKYWPNAAALGTVLFGEYHLKINKFE